MGTADARGPQSAPVWQVWESGTGAQQAPEALWAACDAPAGPRAALWGARHCVSPSTSILCPLPAPALSPPPHPSHCPPNTHRNERAWPCAAPGLGTQPPQHPPGSEQHTHTWKNESQMRRAWEGGFCAAATQPETPLSCSCPAPVAGRLEPSVPSRRVPTGERTEHTHVHTCPQSTHRHVHTRAQLEGNKAQCQPWLHKCR